VVTRLAFPAGVVVAVKRLKVAGSPLEIVTVPMITLLLYISTGNGVVESVEKYIAWPCEVIDARDIMGANQCSVSLCAKTVLIVRKTNTRLSRNLFIYWELGFLQN
jgi:hypothetical protein